jgi:phosphomannomutase
MRELKISNYGVRGVVGSGMTPNLALEFGSAFGTMLGKGSQVVVGRDTRASGEFLSMAFISGLRSTGCQIIDLGIQPTPVIQYAVKKTGFQGGVSIGASINPFSWNAIKFHNQEGAYLNSSEAGQLIDIYNAEMFDYAETPELGKVRTLDPLDDYVDNLAKYFSPELIGSAKFKVVADCNNGTASNVIAAIAKKFNFQITAINNVTDVKTFSHPPEPNAESLKQQVCPVVDAVGADLGVVFDIDADRIAVADGAGNPVAEENIVCLAAEYMLEKKQGHIVITNLSTTRALNDIVEKYSGQLIRSRVGRVYAVDQLGSLDIKDIAIIGEGTGSVMFPELSLAFDGFASLLCLLSLLATRKKDLGILVSELPVHFMKKARVSLSSRGISAFMSELRLKYKNENADFSDGVWVENESRWLHIRPSQTEQAVRIIVESRKEAPDKAVNALMHRARKYASL